LIKIQNYTDWLEGCWISTFSESDITTSLYCHV